MSDSWALPVGSGMSSLAHGAYRRERALNVTADPYPDDTERGLDPTSLTGTKGAYDPYTGAFGTAGTPVTCGYGMSGSTIGLGYTAGRRLWEEGGYRGASPATYSYEHGGAQEPAPKRSQGAPTPSPAQERSAAFRLSSSLLERLLGEPGAAA